MDFNQKIASADRAYERQYWRIGAKFAASLKLSLQDIIDNKPKAKEWLLLMRNESVLFHSEFQSDMLGIPEGNIQSRINKAK